MIALPIDEHLPAVLEALRARSNLVLTAEPGAGKTTRVPRALLDEGAAGTVLVVQPRRLATRMAATRVADELGEAVGGRVGYRVRFETKVSKDTKVEFLTEGILGRRLLADPRLDGVGAVVFDELHERHLEADLALARVRRLQAQRRGLRIVAMSATLDPGPVAAFLGDAPVLSVPGRTHPVEVRFAQRPDDRPIERQVRAATVRLLRDGLEGDVLVFLPGAGAIRRCLKELEGPAQALDVDVLPLHGDLPAAEQDRAVRRGPRRRVVLSTNVAETSLTLEGVVAVVDSGLARFAEHSPWTGLPSLTTGPISQASATQRAGRAGRVQPGVCERLYTKGDFAARPARDRPEIARADLAATVLGLRVEGEDPRAFPFFEAPPAAAVDAADTLLTALGAVADGEATDLGRRMVRLPVHPRLGRVAIEAARRGFARQGATLAALLGERDVRLRSRADFARGGRGESREVASSDLLVRLDELDALGPRPAARMARGAGLDGPAVRTVLRVADQLERAMGKTATDRETFDEEEALLSATLSGFPDRVAKRRRPGRPELVFAAGGSGALAPESAVQEAEWLVALEVEASRGKNQVRLASAIEPEQLLDLAGDQLEERREVRFDPDRERVTAVAELRYGALVVDASPTEPDDAEAAAELARAALDAGVSRFLDADALDGLRRRLHFARDFDDSLPELTNATLETLLARLAEGRRSFAELEGQDLMTWLRAELGAGVLARLDRLAPATVAIPGRRAVAVTYEADRPPWIQSRLQDFFGATKGPTVANGKVALVLHLLAPNRRAVQVTSDLAGFWARHYEDLAKQLRRRYPKHSWPEDPAAASPPPPRGRRR